MRDKKGGDNMGRPKMKRPMVPLRIMVPEETLIIIRKEGELREVSQGFVVREMLRWAIEDEDRLFKHSTAKGA